MSRSPAIVHFANGSVMYGLWDGTVECMFPKLYSTAVERDIAWENWNKLECPSICSCTGDECVLIDDEFSPLHVSMGRACKTHGLFLSRNRTQPDDDIVPELYRTIDWWNHTNPQLRECARTERIEASRAFESLFERLIKEYTKGKTLQPTLAEMIKWKN